MQRQRVFLAAALLSIYAARSAGAITYDWNNAAGGFYGTPGNWTPAGPPTSNDTARFSLANTYTVTLNTSASVNALSQTQGDVTLNLNNSFFTASSATNNILGAAGLTSTLRVTAGNFIPGSFAVGGVTGSTSNLYLDTASSTTVNFGTFYVGTSGTGNL